MFNFIETVFNIEYLQRVERGAVQVVAAAQRGGAGDNGVLGHVQALDQPPVRTCDEEMEECHNLKISNVKT